MREPGDDTELIEPEAQAAVAKLQPVGAMIDGTPHTYIVTCPYCHVEYPYEGLRGMPPPKFMVNQKHFRCMAENRDKMKQSWSKPKSATEQTKKGKFTR